MLIHLPASQRINGDSVHKTPSSISHRTCLCPLLLLLVTFLSPNPPRFLVHVGSSFSLIIIYSFNRHLSVPICVAGIMDE